MPRAAEPQDELLKGTLDMLILKTLTVQPMHGYAIAQHIERLSNGVFAVEQGSLYPALERLQTHGLVTSKWGPSLTGTASARSRGRRSTSASCARRWSSTSRSTPCTTSSNRPALTPPRARPR